MVKILTETERQTHVLDSNPIRSVFADTGVSEEEFADRLRRAPVAADGSRTIDTSNPDKLAEVKSELRTDEKFAEFSPVEKKF